MRRPQRIRKASAHPVILSKTSSMSGTADNAGQMVDRARTSIFQLVGKAGPCLEWQSHLVTVLESTLKASGSTCDAPHSPDGGFRQAHPLGKSWWTNHAIHRILCSVARRLCAPLPPKDVVCGGCRVLARGRWSPSRSAYAVLLYGTCRSHQTCAS